jgi:hypothetical protein
MTELKRKAVGASPEWCPNSFIVDDAHGGSTLQVLKKYVTGFQNRNFSTLTYLGGHCNLGFGVISCKIILPFHSKLLSK